MATDLVEIDSNEPSDKAIERAASEIRRGRLVAIPTDALYTIVADPFNLQAVDRVFRAKDREAARSLPLLVGDMHMVQDLAREVNSRFNLLARRFWPGPLTIILPASERLPLKVTGNTGRLAVRQSRSAVTEKLILKLGHPLIATSANLSGQPTLNNGIDVFVKLDGRVDLVLDGGVCTGQGSTTVDITEPYWRLIKEGAIEEREIADALRGV